MSPQSNCSLIESLASLNDEERAEALAEIDEEQAAELLYDWGANARSNQMLPLGDWLYWLVLAGRGFGKTRVGAETVREWAKDPTARILIVGPVASDVREVMIEGPSGLMSCYPPGSRPQYNPSRHLVTFPSGAIGITRSADEPERLRGPQFTKFWADEVAAWRFIQEAWDQIMFGFRLITPELRGIITTTPKPLDVIKKLVANPKSVVTRASSYENRLNLSESYYRDVIAPYEGTRLGRQEIYGEILDDIPGALWKHAMIDCAKIWLHEVRWDLLVRIVVAVDPAVTSGEKSNETGICVAGLTLSGHVVVLDDLSLRGTPLEWGQVAIGALVQRRGDRIVGEVNNGGDLVERNIRAVNANVPYRAVRASRGKMRRAEPVAALYEQGRVHHVLTGDREHDRALEILEDQMCSYVPGVDHSESPDRMDALVWAITDLVIDVPAEATTVYLNDPASYRISAI